MKQPLTREQAFKLAFKHLAAKKQTVKWGVLIQESKCPTQWRIYWNIPRS